MPRSDEWIKYRETYPFSEDKQDKFYPFYNDYRGYRGDFKQPGYNPDAQTTYMYNANLYTDGLTLSPYLPQNRILQHLKDRFNTLYIKINKNLDAYTNLYNECLDYQKDREDVVSQIDAYRELLPTLPLDQRPSYEEKIHILEKQLTNITEVLELNRRYRAGVHAHTFTYVLAYDKVGRGIAKRLDSEDDILRYQDKVMGMYKYYSSFTVTDNTQEALNSLEFDALRNKIYILNLNLKTKIDERTEISNELKLLDRDLNDLNYKINLFEQKGPTAPDAFYLEQSDMYLKYEKISNELSNINSVIDGLKSQIHNSIETMLLGDNNTVNYIEDYNLDYERLYKAISDNYKTILDYIRDNRI